MAKTEYRLRLTQIRGKQSSDQRHDEQVEGFYFMTQEDYLHRTSDIPKNDARTGTILQTELFSVVTVVVC